MTTPTAPAGDTAAAASSGETANPDVEKVRSWTGLYAVIASDTAIAVAAILGITHFAGSGTANSQSLPQVVAILSSAFTAIATLTTAYFGIKSMANTANNLAGPPTGTAAARPVTTPTPTPTTTPTVAPAPEATLIPRRQIRRYRF